MRRIVGFTLVEVTVVVSVLAILATVIFANFNQGSAQSRDAKRQADLRNLQAAIELYKNEHGRYPAGCNGPGNWSGQSGSGHDCLSGSQYIVGHEAGISFAPKFIRTLPTDPKLKSGVDSGYVYIVNTAGTVYKIMAAHTVEEEQIFQITQHTFKSCDVTNFSGGVCDNVHFNSDSVAPGCSDSDEVFTKSYGLWGGYATPTAPPGIPLYDLQIERLTEIVICQMP